MKKIIGAVLLLSVLGVAGYFYFKQQPKVQYKTVQVERGSITSAVSATGTLNAVVTVQVGTQVSGTISKLYADFNSQVKKGEPIAQIDPALFASAVQQARGNALNAEASLAKARVTLADTKRTLNRNRELLEQGIISQSDLDVARTAYETALAGVQGAQAVVMQTRGALKQAETNLNYATIRSPVDGTVVSRNVDVGQTVAASFQTPTLFTIAQDLTKMQIETSVDESDISRLQVGQVASFTVDAYPERQFEGAVVQIRNAPVVTQNVVTYVVVIGVGNKEMELKPGMTANVSVQVQRKDDVLKIPSAALRFKPKPDKDGKDLKGAGGKGGTAAVGAKGAGRRRGGAGENSGEKQGGKGEGQKSGPKQTVYLLKDENTPVPVSIGTGISDGGFVEVTGGDVKEGDEVVVEQMTPGKDKKAGRPSMGPRF